MLSDIRVFNQLAKCYNIKDLRSIFATHKKEEKGSYNQRVTETEKGYYSLLVFECTVRMSIECETFYCRLADLLTIKENFKKVQLWDGCKPNFLSNYYTPSISASEVPEQEMKMK